MHTPSSAARAAAIGLAVALVAPSASAGGLYFSDRGVRPLARGGAFVAGADDLHAIWYNPAGVYDAGSEILFDVSWLNFSTDYTRRALVRQRDPNTGEEIAAYEQTFPTVDGTSQAIPIPTLAGSYKIADDWVIALGALAPYAAIPSYPETIDGQPAPSRYSLITLEGSALALFGAWVAWAPSDEWRFGIGLQALAGTFSSTIVLGACVPDRFFCAYEQPAWDALSQLDVGPIFAPSGNAGVQWIPHEMVRIGGSFQAPFAIRAPATMKVRLPATPAFERASIEGDEASVAFELPWSARLGVQVSPVEDLAIELAGAIEGWSMHDAITIAPEGQLRNLPGFPNPYALPAIDIPRNFQDTWSVRLGAEWLVEGGGLGWQMRAGASYESSAVPEEYLSVLTVDIPKVTLALGLGIHYEDARFDVMYAHVFGPEVVVDPDEARMPLLSPVQANIPEAHTINGGNYNARAHVVGIGLRYDFDGLFGADADEPEDEEASEEGEGA